MKFNETSQDARSQHPLPSLCFSGRSEKKMAALASDWLRYFQLLLWIRWTEFNKTWHEARAQWPLPSLCFRADQKNKMAALASDWLRHFRLFLWNRWTEFNETWQKARSQRLLPSLCHCGQSQKQDGRPGLWLAETFSTSLMAPLKGIQRNLTGSKISKSSTKFVFFRLIGKTRWPPQPLIGWDIFDFFSETAERNSTKLDRKQTLNVLLKFVFFGPIRKTRWLPWPLIGWDIFDFSDETAERNSKELDRKQDFKVLYQVCVFRADWKNKMAAPASDLLRHFRLLLWNRWTEFNKTWQEKRSQCPLPSLCFLALSEKQDGRPSLCWLRHFRLLWNCWREFDETWQEARSQHPWPSLCFSGRSVKKRWPPWPMIGWDILTSPLKLLNGIQRNLTGSKISTFSTKLCFSVWWVNKNYRPGWSVKKVAHFTQVHDMWPFGPPFYVFI